MSKNIHQVYVDNPITSNEDTDLMYFGQAPYGSNDNAAMLFSDFADQFSSGGVTNTQVQRAAFNLGVDTGTGTAYAVALTPVITEYTDGLLVSFSPNAANTSINPTISINGLSAQPIYINFETQTLNIGDITENLICYMIYSDQANAFILLNPQLSNSVSGEVLTGTNYWVSDDQGMAADDYEVIIPLSESSGGNEYKPVFIIMYNANATNTGASTLTIQNVGSPIDIVTPQGDGLTAGQIEMGGTYLFFFDSVAYRLINPSGASGGGVSSTQVQQSVFNRGNDTGSGTAYEVDLSPAVESYTDGLFVSFVPDNDNTSIYCTLALNGLAAKGIQINFNLGYLMLGDMNSNATSYLMFSSALDQFILLNPQKSLAVARDILTGNGYWTGSDQGGGANDYELTLAASTAYSIQEFSPVFCIMYSANATNTGASTFTVTGVSTPFDLLDPNGNALVAGQIVSGQTYYLFFDGSAYRVLNPSISSTLASIAKVQQQGYNYGVDSGSSTAYAIALTPPIQSYTDGLLIAFEADSTNTTNLPTINVDGLGAVSVRVNFDTVAAIGDISQQRVNYFIYSASGGGVFYLLNPQVSGVHGLDLLTGAGYWVATDAGVAANAYSVSIPFSETYTLLPYPPLFIQMIAANDTNTGASNIEVVNVGSYPIILDGNGQALTGGEIIQFNTYFMVYDSNIQGYILQNSSLIQMQSKPLITKPGVGSQSSALTLAAAYQNTFDYDVVLTVYLDVASATTADITLGVGSTNSPTPQTIVSGLTTATQTILPVSIYLPKDYYALLDTSGTISVTISGQQAMPV